MEGTTPKKESATAPTPQTSAPEKSTEATAPSPPITVNVVFPSELTDAVIGTKKMVEKIAATQKEEQEDKAAKAKTPTKVEVVNQKSDIWEFLSFLVILSIAVILMLGIYKLCTLPAKPSEAAPNINKTQTVAPKDETIAATVTEDKINDVVKKIDEVKRDVRSQIDEVKADVAKATVVIGVLKDEVSAIKNRPIAQDTFKAEAIAPQSPKSKQVTVPDIPTEYVNILSVSMDSCAIMDSYKKVSTLSVKQKGRSVEFVCDNGKPVVLTGNIAFSRPYTESDSKTGEITLSNGGSVHNFPPSTVYTDSNGAMFYEVSKETYQRAPEGSSYDTRERIFAQ